MDLIGALDTKSQNDILLTKLMDNISSINYKDFLNQLEDFVKESKSKKGKNFNYILNNDGNLEKICKDETCSNENRIIKVPIFKNINSNLDIINDSIQLIEYKLKLSRDELLDEKSTSLDEFNKLKDTYYKFIEDRKSITTFFITINKIVENKDIIERHNAENISICIQQNLLLKQINSLIKENSMEQVNKLINDYLQNNIVINNNNNNIKEINERELISDLVLEVFENKQKLVKKSTLKPVPKFKLKVPKQQKSSKDIDKTLTNLFVATPQSQTQLNDKLKLDPKLPSAPSAPSALAKQTVPPQKPTTPIEVPFPTTTLIPLSEGKSQTKPKKTIKVKKTQKPTTLMSIPVPAPGPTLVPVPVPTLGPAPGPTLGPAPKKTTLSLLPLPPKLPSQLKSSTLKGDGDNKVNEFDTMLDVSPLELGDNLEELYNFQPESMYDIGDEDEYNFNKENINQKDDMSDVNLFFDEETTKSVKNDSSDPNIKIIKINNESQ